MNRVIWPVVAAVLVLGGCGDESVAPASSGGDVRDQVAGTWYPLEIAGWTVSDFGRSSYGKAYLRFDDGDWKASDGCNGQRGTYDLTAEGAFGMESAASTETGCANVPHVDVMGRATQVRVDGDTLVFEASGEHPSELARYTREKNPPPTSTPSATSSVADGIRKRTEASTPPPP
ncbi:META domain-containing protein [Kineosporia sp. NBRC 101731]|uniref:META domain-containing protein n=1 Tax=Kineosporia sp. NBRC 101731 TaxID=3032199 RepID=UPI0024A29ABE|nr:META domain-containing protein [Kineosporia sp. NBRC 101731]GLY33014.1 hypothetical protein Kisp02_63790 [Kineosporia sp. NBRC 101731]